MISQEIKHSENNKVLLFTISCKTIGGAERRILNLAYQVSKLKPELKIKLLITQNLYEEYQKDTQLLPLIADEKIEINFAEWPQNLQTLIQKKQHLYQKIIKRLLRLINLVSEPLWRVINSPSKTSLHSDASQNIDKIKRDSWFQEMLNLTKPGDHIHCFVGRIERRGAILLAKHGRKVVIEITSNRMLPDITSDCKFLFPHLGLCPTLYLNCVSKTVYNNFLTEIGSDFLEQYQVSCGYYKTPSLPLELLNCRTSKVRENIVVFGHRFIAAKNGILFAQVVSDMYKRGELSNWKVHFRGAGPEEEAIKQILEAETLAGCVEIGWSHDIEGELQHSKIFISIIATGSYPSQSVFQSMKNGNLLVLGDVGETVEQFAHENIYFTKIEKDAIRTVLLKAMADATDATIFSAKSNSMKQLFRTFSEKSTQAKELLSLHLHSEKNSP
jgi:hypothetical protein